MIQGPASAMNAASKANAESGATPRGPNASNELGMSDLVRRSNALDSSFIEERGKGVIEENEVLIRGEWKRPAPNQNQNQNENDDEDDNDNDNDNEDEDEDEDEDEENGETVETVRDSGHSCAYCGKPNVSWGQ